MPDDVDGALKKLFPENNEKTVELVKKQFLTRDNMTTSEIRKLISNVFWDLKKDFDSDMDTRDIYYDTGYMVSLCVAIGKVFN